MFPVTSQDRILSVLDIVGTIGHFWGYLTALVTWSCTVETLYDGFAVGAVLLVSCIFLTVFEVYVPVHVHFLRRIVSDENNWFKKVDSLEFKGVSKMKTVVYACLGVLSCLEPNEVWLAALS
uniref:Uncharacterized protein n=1 Tax=Plectus sambesii TaxID=2011161 RepID=A0A914XRZ7_9BILA